MMGTATAMKRQELSDAAQMFAAIECHRISLTPGIDGKIWLASADILGTRHNRRRPIASVDAYAGTSLDAVRALVAKLEGGVD